MLDGKKKYYQLLTKDLEDEVIRIKRLLVLLRNNKDLPINELTSLVNQITNRFGIAEELLEELDVKTDNDHSSIKDSLIELQEAVNTIISYVNLNQGDSGKTSIVTKSETILPREDNEVIKQLKSAFPEASQYYAEFLGQYHYLIEENKDNVVLIEQLNIDKKRAKECCQALTTFNEERTFFTEKEQIVFVERLTNALATINKKWLSVSTDKKKEFIDDIEVTLRLIEGGL